MAVSPRTPPRRRWAARRSRPALTSRPSTRTRKRFRFRLPPRELHVESRHTKRFGTRRRLTRVGARRTESRWSRPRRPKATRCNRPDRARAPSDRPAQLRAARKPTRRPPRRARRSEDVRAGLRRRAIWPGTPIVPVAGLERRPRLQRAALDPPGPMVAAHDQHAASFLPNGNVILIGGQGLSGETNFSRAEINNASTGDVRGDAPPHRPR